MILRTIFTICIISVSTIAYGQQRLVDSLKVQLPNISNDTLRLIALGRIISAYREINSDSALTYAAKTVELSRSLKLRLDESFALSEMGYALMNLGRYPRALESYLAAEAISRDPASEKILLPDRFLAFDEFSPRSLPARSQRLSCLSRTLQDMAVLYLNANDYSKGKRICEMAIPLATEAKNLKILSIVYSTLGRAYFFLNKADSALIFQQKSYEYVQRGEYTRYVGTIVLNLGRAYLALGDLENAKKFFKQSVAESAKSNYQRGVVAGNLELAKLFGQANLKDSSFHYATNGVKIASSMAVPELLLRCYRELANYYTSIGKSDSSSKYLSRIVELNDKLVALKQIQEFQNIDFEEQQRKDQLEAAEAAFRHRLFNYAMAGVIIIVAVVAIVLFKSNQQKQKDKAKIESAFQQLKATQSQLIQSEKMASLGELTAGIAHEIQNPLNFVNNFSELNNELLEDLTSELEKGDLEAAKNVVRDIFNNHEKINQHGKRADGIVKSMLEHSVKSSGVKTPTELNSLCDEYLRLAYHGLRARDKSFNASIEKDFNPNLPKVHVVSQDIGRVILNLVNNALYTVNEKRKRLLDGYSPVVHVSTQIVAGEIHIRIKDNGQGISPSVKEKIFQPFFTTKPPGQGTGLGLSLAYDIVTKGHGGRLSVDTVEGEGSAFLITLPLRT